MELWKHAKHLHYEEKRYRCNVCGNEEIDPIVPKKEVKPIEEKKSKK